MNLFDDVEIEKVDWHKEFHHNTMLSIVGHHARLVEIEKRLAALEGIEYKPVDQSVVQEDG